MRVLFTNNTLAQRSGSELYVRDVATALLARGHEPIAYSRRLGEVAHELRQATVAVVDDPAALSTPPDLIHAQHHLEAMTALTRFPDTPAIYVCHGWLPAEEAPPRHPRILRYVAVDDLVRRRLEDECGIEPQRIVVQRNFVDLERFRPRGPLPERPRRALVFSHQISEVDGLPELRRACERRGLELHTAGRRMGTDTDAPEELLAEYDVVFGKARAAMEALAVGCCVVLCDAVGLGPTVTAADFDRLRAFNFGVRLLRDPITADAVEERLGAYDPDDAAEASRRLRRDAGLDRAVERLLELYDEVLDEHGGETVDLRDASRAVSHYLRFGPLTGGDRFQAERAAYQAELTRAGDYARALLAQLEATRKDRDAVESRRTEVENAFRRAEAQRVAEAESRQASLEALDQKHRDAERRLAETQDELRSAHDELAWMKNSLTWRWRSRLVGTGWLRRLYRALRGLDR